LAGEARFTDGKRYRFVMHDGKIGRMALPFQTWDKKEDWKYRDSVFPLRAKLIEAAYQPTLDQARIDHANWKADEEKKRKEQYETAMKQKARADAEPLAHRIITFLAGWLRECGGDTLPKPGTILSDSEEETVGMAVRAYMDRVNGETSTPASSL
jgi:hypothetical protein